MKWSRFGLWEKIVATHLLVAAACAITAGWIRTVGQVTAVVTGSFVTWEIAPIVDRSPTAARQLASRARRRVRAPRASLPECSRR